MINPFRAILNLARRRAGVHDRVHERHNCCTMAKLDIASHGTTLDGMMLEVSRGGALFREASSYILDRYGCSVTLNLPGFSRAATIVNVRSEGYGVRWANPLTSEELGELLTRHGDGEQLAA
jgi:hypothetical protein